MQGAAQGAAEPLSPKYLFSYGGVLIHSRQLYSQPTNI